MTTDRSPDKANPVIRSKIPGKALADAETGVDGLCDAELDRIAAGSSLSGALGAFSNALRSAARGG